MADIVTSIEIAASPERVWRVLADVRAFDEWNPFITRFHGALEKGALIAFRVPLSGRDVPIKARMLHVEPLREIRWMGPPNALLARAFSGEHYFRLEPLAPDRTKFVHGETFRGALVGPFWSRLERRLLPLYEAMNAALRKRVEGG